ncbi:MAG: hypothetical protein II748_06240 [Clostridia bacterium]|nr:hypothetical protein [Clostridia bacterium]
MTDSKFKFLLVLIPVIVFSVVFSGCEPKKPDKAILSQFPAQGEYSEELNEAIRAYTEESPADDLEKTAGVISWWDNYPRFNYGNAGTLEKMHADLDTTGSRNDEGRGAFARKVDSLTGIPALNVLHKKGFKGGVWLECQGTTSAFVVALRQLEDGTFEIDPKTGAAKLYGWVWGWSSTKPGVSRANYVAWAGVHSFVNNEEWAYPYVLSEYDYIDTPTFPDGTLATGYYDDGDRLTPQLSKFYDSACAKDINGNFIIAPEGASMDGDEFAATFYDASSYKRYRALEQLIPKDTADPFWIQYAKSSVDFWVEQGVDYFWIDNWNGWDCIGNYPIRIIFGDWSEYKFKQYLKDHPELGVKDADNFSIVKYMKDRALEIDPDCYPGEVTDKVWNNKAWIDDPIWKAYLSFKIDSNREYNTSLHKLVKEASLKYRGDEDAVLACGNDFPYLTYGAFDGEGLDMISTEYNGNYLAATGSVTSGFAPNRYSGHAYKLLSDAVRAHNAVIWYYATNYPYTDNSTKVYSYEALANNVLLHQGFSGTNKSNLDVNLTIEYLKDTFQDRRAYAGIGVVYSPDSETNYLTPGGFNCDGPIPHTISYSGWCSAFDELNIPYKGIWLSRLKDRIDNLEILILPQVCSIDESYIDILSDFVKKGGKIIITGAASGLYDCQTDHYTKRDSAILVEFAKKNKKNVFYYENDPCFEYFVKNKTSDFDTMYNDYLKNVEKIVNVWYDKGYLTKYIEFEDLEAKDSYMTTLNYCTGNETFFIDLVNMQYDSDTDVLTPTRDKTTFTVRVPSTFWGHGFKVSLYTNGTEEIRELKYGEDFTVEGAYATISVPQFDVYACVMISK